MKGRNDEDLILQEYLGALLGEPGGTNAGGRIHLVLVRAGGVRLAFARDLLVLPALAKPPGNARLVDLRQLISAPAGCEPQAWLPLAGEGAVALGADLVEEVAAVQAEEISYRETRLQKPWLAGMIQSLGAAVIDPGKIPEEENG